MGATFKKWFFATRPWSFVVSATPVILTVVYLLWKGEYADFSWLNAVGALIGIVLFHAAGNVFSDYYDYKNGIDAEDTVGVKTLVSGEFTPRQFYYLALGLFAAAIILGVLLTLNSGWELLIIGGLGFLLTLLYPRLKFIALGDACIFVVYGILPMLGASFVTTGVFDWDTLVLSVPVGCITVAVLHANNARDIETDIRVGAKSVAYLMGGGVSVVAYIVEIVAPSVFTVACVIAGLLPVWCLAILLSAPVVLRNVKQALKYKEEGLAAFNMLDLMTAQLQMVSGICLLAGFILAIIF